MFRQEPMVPGFANYYHGTRKASYRLRVKNVTYSSILTERERSTFFPNSSPTPPPSSYPPPSHTLSCQYDGLLSAPPSLQLHKLLVFGHRSLIKNITQKVVIKVLKIYIL